MVDALDAANYLMTGSGLYLLLGVLLAALGGFYLTRPTGSLDKGSSADYQDNPAVPATSKTMRSSTHARHASAPTGEDGTPQPGEKADKQKTLARPNRLAIIDRCLKVSFRSRRHP
ncbi:hypothetical protein [Arthrobacter sp. OV608]|uniref:hypothetical protein n=1 Tax=Arthrobacter sp. OV608 TaxID=1882768 RepID=UPI0008B83534|nr:hypothetical protein [Arthrobacter sp. OV608]SER31679.1 hypothetical protein SAMN05444745_13412 [Arthrobacter sp. OV608]